MSLDQARNYFKNKIANSSLTQMELAEITGVSQASISLFLRGSGLSVKNYEKVMEQFGEFLQYDYEQTLEG